MEVHGCLHMTITGHGSEMLGVDCFAGFFLLNDAQHTVIKMLVEVLSIAECL